MADDDAPKRSRDHLRLVTEPETLEATVAAAGRPRTIGRLIAQTAILAEESSERRQRNQDGPRGLGERLLGRFR